MLKTTRKNQVKKAEKHEHDTVCQHGPLHTSPGELQTRQGRGRLTTPHLANYRPDRVGGD